MHTASIPFTDPFEAYTKLYRKDSVLLESQKNGQFSYIALNPYKIFKSKKNKITINKKTFTGNPIEELKKIFKKNKERLPTLPLFNNGAIGYFGYDIVHFFEKLPRTAKDDLNLPDIYLIFPTDIIFFDHKNKLAKIISKKRSNIKKIKHQLTIPIILPKESNTTPIFTSNFNEDSYKRAIEKCKNYVKEGDSFQIKISQRFQTEITDHPLNIYKRLKKINPSPYAAFLNLNNFTLISSSPEHLVKKNKNNIETRPIGGTYPLNKSKKQFLQDKKEVAEHRMLIDLERNDLGKVCIPGSIKVNELMTVEKYSHLNHIVTNIKGKTKANVFDILKAMFPGGTITGCPKIRTMEIIDELEPTTRGPYTGSIGFINHSNEMDLNIIIRTLIIKNNIGYIQTGGGIVADSKPKTEYNETIHKAKALMESVR